MFFIQTQVSDTGLLGLYFIDYELNNIAMKMLIVSGVISDNY